MRKDRKIEKRKALKKYIVGFDPDRTSEACYENCHSLGEAHAEATSTRLRKKYTAWKLESFDTIEERTAYIKGLEAAFGYSGYSEIYKNNPK